MIVDSANPRGLIAMWLNGKEPLKLCHHPAKYGGQRHGSNEDIMVLVCRVNLQDQVVKGSCDLMQKN